MNVDRETDFGNRFREALKSGLIQAWFQPVFRAMTGRITVAEALARWFTPEGEMLSPADFIPALERDGLIFDLDMEILRQACVLYQEFQQRGTPLRGVSVNLSRLDFKQENLFETVCATLDRYAVPHEAIKLEITEGMMLEDTETFEKIFQLFSDAGFTIWLDDFGSGYSSLNVLQNYSFDVIKFDMLFLRKLSVRGREMLASLTSMAKTLGIHTLTEGVETKEQRDFLLSIGCEALQGFLYSKPLSAEKLTELVDQNPGILESPEDAKYWNAIGRLNFVNPNPLKDFAERRRDSAGTGTYVSSYDGSIALVECGRDHFEYIYATEGYRERLRDLGFATVGGLEHALSSQRSHQYLIFHKLVMDALRTGTVHTVEYAYKDVYFRLSALSVARKEGRAMIVMRLNTFDSEREVQTAQELLNSSSALLTTYDLVVLFYPERKAAKRVFTANSMAEYDQEESFEISLRKFCTEQVDPVDQERYLQFMNFSTMEERVGESPKHFIQSLFRMRLGQGTTGWYSARLTQVPSRPEKVFMLTVQNVQANLQKWMNLIVEEYPDML